MPGKLILGQAERVLLLGMLSILYVLSEGFCMGLHTETAIYRSTYELAQLVTRLVSQMPRNYKPTLGMDLQRLCLKLVMRVYEANGADRREKDLVLLAHERIKTLAVMRKEIEAANLMARLAKDLRLISNGQYSQAIKLLSDIGKQATGWIKHTESRLSLGRHGGRASAHR